MSSERIAVLCRTLLPQVETIERDGRRCVILGKLPAEPDKPAIGFVFDSAFEVPREAFASSPDLEEIIRTGISEYRIGGELPVIMHVVGTPPRVEYILFKRPRFTAAHAAMPAANTLATIAAAVKQATSASVTTTPTTTPTTSPTAGEMDAYVDELTEEFGAGLALEPVAERDEVPRGDGKEPGES
jgi:hypothetical protein